MLHSKANSDIQLLNLNILPPATVINTPIFIRISPFATQQRLSYKFVAYKSQYFPLTHSTALCEILLASTIAPMTFHFASVTPAEMQRFQKA